MLLHFGVLGGLEVGRGRPRTAVGTLTSVGARIPHHIAVDIDGVAQSEVEPDVARALRHVRHTDLSERLPHAVEDRTVGGAGAHDSHPFYAAIAAKPQARGPSTEAIVAVSNHSASDPTYPSAKVGAATTRSKARRRPPLPCAYLRRPPRRLPGGLPRLVASLRAGPLGLRRGPRWLAWSRAASTTRLPSLRTRPGSARPVLG